MSVCPVDQNGFCCRHQTRHVGHLLDISQDPSARGEAFRLMWDGVLARRPKPKMTIEQRAAARKAAKR